MTHKILGKYRKLCEERGSALLISLMVMVGLSMLGLGFVALSETEAAISTNQRNREEVLTHAEAAANVVVDWFQAPVWAATKGLGPSNNSAVNTELNAMKLTRTVGGTGGGTGKYKPSSAEYLFDLPFKPNVSDRFYGTPDHPDILINKTTAPTFLANFNNLLFKDTVEAGRISEIRIFAPPIVNGTINAQGYYDNNVGTDARYGVATVRVTAQKVDASNNVIAQRVVQLVVTEFPFPGPNGPIESNSAITTNGSFTVYWGQVSSQKTLTLKQQDTLPGLPWSSAWNPVEYEHGYDSTREWKINTNYATGDVVHASQAAISADVNLEDWSFKCTSVGGCQSANAVALEPKWDATNSSGTTYNEKGSGSGTWTQQPARMWPLFGKDPSLHTDDTEWFKQTLGWKIADPWAETRTRSNLVNAPNANPEPYGLYTDPAQDPFTTSGGSFTTFLNWFQFQTKDLSPQYKIVAFPHIDYDFWKQIAMAGDGQPGVYYFKYDDATDKGLFYRLTDSTTKKTMPEWVNSCTGVSTGMGPGLYFFDSRKGTNPQGLSDPTTVLTPEVKLTNQDAKPCFTMKGFIYSNTITFSSKGVKGDDTKLYNYPGEPFRDVGFRLVDTSKTPKEFKRDTITNRLLALQNPRVGKWDYQEINNNGVFDYVLQDLGGTKKPDGTLLPSPTYVPVEWYEGCTVPDLVAGTAGNCSEPHEPYLNLIYPPDTSVAFTALPTDIKKADPTQPGAVYTTVGWEAMGSQTRLAREATTTAMTTPVNCSAESATSQKCTSNAYDETGPLANLGGPILEGVMYIEGQYNSEGNATYYGSILVQGDCCGTGTPNVYFDQSLLTQDFKKKFPTFPRVYISSYSTE